MTDHPSALVSVPVELMARISALLENPKAEHPHDASYLIEEVTALAAAPAAPYPVGVVGRVAKACADFQEAIDYFEADVADVMAEGSERADLWDREVTVNIDALKAVMNAALCPPSREPEGGAVDDGALKIATDLHAAYEQLIYGLPKYLDAENLTDEENMIREAWITLDVTAHRLAALAARADPCASHKAEGISLDPCCPTCEAPAEAGEAARIIARHLPLTDAPDTVCLPITMTAGDLRTVYAALRAQPPAREDAQPVALPLEGAPRDGTMLRLRVRYEAANQDEAWTPLEDSEESWTIGFNNFDNTGDDRWQFVGWDWSQDHLLEATGGAVIGWLPFHTHLAPDAQPVGWLRAADEEMVCAHLGVAEAEDSYETAKKKLASLIQWNIAVAMDPSVGGHPAPDALRVAVEALESFRMMRSDRKPGSYPKTYKGGFDAASDVVAGWATKALAALQAEQKGGAA